MFFWSCSSADDGGGDGQRDGHLVAEREVQDLRHVPRGERRDDPDDEEQHGDDRQPPGPPRLEELLAEEDAEAAHAAAPVLSGRPPSPVSRRNTSSSVGLARATDTTVIPAAATASRIARPASTGLSTAIVSRPWSSAAAVTQGRARRSASERLHRDGLARFRLDPPHGQGVAVEQLGEAAFDDEPPMVQDRDAVADALDVGQDVGGEQDGGLAAQRGDQLQDVPAALGVEGAHRLVQDDDGRLVDERPGDPEPLAHAAGVRSGAAVGGLGEVHAGKRDVDGAGEGRSVQPVQPAEHRELLPAGHPAVRARVLLEVAEPAADAQRVHGDRDPGRRSRSRRSAG